jgi:CheY-like chemotaxis protein
MGYTAMSAETRAAHQPKRILVVDDDPDVRLIVTLLLDAAGYEVDTAQDAYEALLKLYDTHPDLMLLDLMMPESDGFDVVHAVRVDPETRGLPIVIMSAKLGLINLRHHEVQGYVPKPLDAVGLVETIEQVLRQNFVSPER